MNAGINIALEALCIVICLLIMFFFLLERNETSRIDKYFVAMLTINILALISDMSSFTFEGNPKAIQLLYLVKMLSYLSGYMLFGIYIEYITEYLSMYKPVPKMVRYIGTGLAFVFQILVFLQTFTHYLFTVDENGYYVRNNQTWICESGTMVLFAFLLFLSVKYRKYLDAGIIVSLLTFALLPTAATVAQIFTRNTAFVFVFTTLSLLVVYSTIHKETIKRLQSTETELAAARLSLVMSQIRPHFMYNSLTAIAQLCTIDPKRAQQATIDFSNYLRGNLDSVNYTRPIPFTQELKHLKTYLALELMRFEDSLNVKYDIAVEDFLVPALSVQPLVENAVKHGICKRRDGGTVTISTRETEDAFIVEVRDDGVGFDVNKPLSDEKSHIGVSNVRSRVESMMGGSLTVESEVGVGTVSTLTIPKR